MKSIVIFVITLAHLEATKFTVHNNCGKLVEVVRTNAGNEPFEYCQLRPGQSCGEESKGSKSMTFKNGLSGKTLAKFHFEAPDGNDYYNLNVEEGFDIGMRLRSSNLTLICYSRSCTDAVKSPDDYSKTHGVKTGGEFNLHLCR